MFRSELAYENWKSKYRYDKEDPLGTFKRVAYALASVEANPKEWEDRFLNTLVKFDDEGNPVGLKCTTGGRITANVGTSYAHATLMNCFSGDTEYLDVNRGLLRFDEMCSQETTVLTKDGPEKATIECFGIQRTYSYIFKPAYRQVHYRDAKGRITLDINMGKKLESYYTYPRSSYSKIINATKDHRWILSDGTETTELKIGDIVESNTYGTTSTKEQYREGFLHGLIFGDGSLSHVYTNAPNSSGKFGLSRYYIRLCGKKAKYIDLFDEKDITYSPSHNRNPTGFCASPYDLKKIPEV